MAIARPTDEAAPMVLQAPPQSSPQLDIMSNPLFRLEHPLLCNVLTVAPRLLEKGDLPMQLLPLNNLPHITALTEVETTRVTI